MDRRRARTSEKAFFSGIGITAIALELRRTESAVMQQIQALNLYKKSDAHQESRGRMIVCACGVRTKQIVSFAISASPYSNTSLRSEIFPNHPISTALFTFCHIIRMAVNSKART